MKILTTVIAALLLMQSTVRAEEPWRSISRSGTTPPPNVLFITADDLGLQLGCYGDTVIKTPQIDALAASGVQFDVAYVAQASCSPSRSAMFTGLYVHATGQYGLTGGGFALHPHLEDATIPNILKRAGYRTGIIGKLHVGPGTSFQFDYRGGNHVEARDVKLVAQRASEFITQCGEQPFFLMVNYTDPHAYRHRNAETNKIVGGWTFLDRVEGIPETLVQASAKTVFPFQQIDSPEQRKRVAGYYTRTCRSHRSYSVMSMRLSIEARRCDGPTRPWPSDRPLT